MTTLDYDATQLRQFAGKGTPGITSNCASDARHKNLITGEHFATDDALLADIYAKLKLLGGSYTSRLSDLQSVWQNLPE